MTTLLAMYQGQIVEVMVPDRGNGYTVIFDMEDNEITVPSTQIRYIIPAGTDHIMKGRYC